MMMEYILRSVLLAQAGFTLGLVGLIVVAYFRVWRKVDHSRGLLPAHVVAVGIAHSMLIIFGVIEVYIRVGDPLTWRAPYLLAAVVISDFALITVMRLQVRRLRISDCIPEEMPPEDRVEVTIRHDGDAESALLVDEETETLSEEGP